MEKIELPIFEPHLLRLAVFISGSGKTLQNLIHCSNTTHKNLFKIACVASHGNHAVGLGHSFATGIPSYIPSKGNISNKLFNFAEQEEANIVCLAGFLKLLDIPSRWYNRVVNIHPSLIPNFCGKSMFGSRVHQAVIDAKVTKSGCTVHYCNNEYDKGKIILQKELEIQPSWNAHQLADQVFKLELQAYPEALQQISAQLRN